MNRFKNLLSKSPVPIIPKTSTTPAIQSTDDQTTVSKNFQKYTKEGPQLLLTKILMIHGPLQNKQIWRIYTRMLKQNSKLQNPLKIYQFKSLTQMKKIVKFMIDKQKIKSAGYDKKAKQHKGWQVQTDKALKFIHPEAINSIQQAVKSKDVI